MTVFMRDLTICKHGLFRFALKNLKKIHFHANFKVAIKTLIKHYKFVI